MFTNGVIIMVVWFIAKYYEIFRVNDKREHNSINQIRIRIIGNVLGQKYSIYFQKTVSTR